LKELNITYSGLQGLLNVAGGNRNWKLVFSIFADSVAFLVIKNGVWQFIVTFLARAQGKTKTDLSKSSSFFDSITQGLLRIIPEPTMSVGCTSSGRGVIPHRR
jgi:hypothetical protein